MRGKIRKRALNSFVEAVTFIVFSGSYLLLNAKGDSILVVYLLCYILEVSYEDSTSYCWAVCPIYWSGPSENFNYAKALTLIL